MYWSINEDCIQSIFNDQITKIGSRFVAISAKTVTFRSSVAYPQMYYMLEHGDFKQRPMARDLDIPHGARVSGFVNWLVSLKFVEKTKNRRYRLNVYRVVAPLALVKFYSNFRRMEAYRVTRDMGTDRGKVIEYFKEKGSIFCLTTALEHYTEYVRDLAINVYVDDDFWNRMQNKESTGTVRVNMYPFKPFRKDNVIEKDGLKITTKLRTLIDLYCDDKAYAAEPLVRQLWS